MWLAAIASGQCVCASRPSLLFSAAASQHHDGGGTPWIRDWTVSWVLRDGLVMSRNKAYYVCPVINLGICKKERKWRAQKSFARCATTRAVPIQTENRNRAHFLVCFAIFHSFRTISIKNWNRNRFVHCTSHIWICRHLGSLTAANWVSFDFNVSYSSCWGYSLIDTFKLKKKNLVIRVGYWVIWPIERGSVGNSSAAASGLQPSAAVYPAETVAIYVYVLSVLKLDFSFPALAFTSSLLLFELWVMRVECKSAWS